MGHHHQRELFLAKGCYEKNGKYYNVRNHNEYNPKNAIVFENVDELLKHTFDGVTLRDIILKAEITDCSL